MKVFGTKIKAASSLAAMGFAATNKRQTTIYFITAIRIIAIRRDTITNVSTPISIKI